MPPAPAIPVKDKFLPGLAVRLTRMKEVIKTTRPHGHKRYYELIYLTEGAGWHYIDFQRYPVVPHTYYLICPGQVHHWELSEVPRGYVLMVKEEFLAQHPAPVALDELPATLTLAPATDGRAVRELMEREPAARRAPLGGDAGGLPAPAAGAALAGASQPPGPQPSAAPTGAGLQAVRGRKLPASAPGEGARWPAARRAPVPEPAVPAGPGAAGQPRHQPAPCRGGQAPTAVYPEHGGRSCRRAGLCRPVVLQQVLPQPDGPGTGRIPAKHILILPEIERNSTRKRPNKWPNFTVLWERTSLASALLGCHPFPASRHERCHCQLRGRPPPVYYPKRAAARGRRGRLFAGLLGCS
ncbi:MAG: AraC family ligand binding domain-containing protein [Hymenobacter sp.]